MSHLDWGIVLLTKRKIAFSGANWIRLRMIHMNWATVMSLGTKNFRLSMSGICDLGTRSTTTLKMIFCKKTEKPKLSVYRNTFGIFNPNFLGFLFTLIYFERINNRFCLFFYFADYLPAGVSSLNRNFIFNRNSIEIE